LDERYLGGAGKSRAFSLVLMGNAHGAPGKSTGKASSKVQLVSCLKEQ